MKYVCACWMQHVPIFFRTAFLLCGVLLLLAGCPGPETAARNTVGDIIREVEATQRAVEQESGAWRDLLPKLISDLNAMEGTIAADAKDILTSTTNQVEDLSRQTIAMTDAKAQDLIAQAGVEFRCNGDFVKASAMDQLNAIIEDLKFWERTKQHRTTRPKHNVCWINPSSLTLYPVGSEWQIDPTNMGEPYVLHVYGYNFWSETMPGVELQDGSGNKIRDLTVRPSRVTNYLVNLNLASERFASPPADARLVFTWPDGGSPNAVALVPLSPAKLVISDVRFSNDAPQAVMEQVFPRVTVTNIGGRRSERFDVTWRPGPGEREQTQSVDRGLEAGESRLVEFGGFTYNICGPYSTNVSISGGSGSMNKDITVAPYCPPNPAPTPLPERERTVYSDSLTSVTPFGDTNDQDYGVPCSPGYHRSQVTVDETKYGPGSGCYVTGWSGDDAHMCRASIRFWVDAFSKIECRIHIFEVGDQLPAPEPPPSCTCSH